MLNLAPPLPPPAEVIVPLEKLTDEGDPLSAVILLLGWAAAPSPTLTVRGALTGVDPSLYPPAPPPPPPSELLGPGPFPPPPPPPPTTK